MDRSFFSSPNWYRALTLTERITVLKRSEGIAFPNNFNHKRDSQQLHYWRSQPQFADDSTFNSRLTLEGIDEEFLALVLNEPVEQLQQLVDEPAWLNWLAESYQYPATAYANPPPGAEELQFLDLIQPLIDQACGLLVTGIEQLQARWPSRPFHQQSIEDIVLMNLPDPLLLRLGRTMVLELNIARLQGHLEGETPAARFKSFIDQLREPEHAVAILSEYPVLARQIVICLSQWVDVNLEFLDRLCMDWPAILDHFCQGRDPGKLVELVGGAGDTHRDGRSVMIAQFESGFQLVYKPKSLAVDVHFQELLRWLNSNGCQPPLQTLSMLDRSDYGWVEYVERQECKNMVEVERFYRRLGTYLALLYSINASDFHLENLIACGEHPMLIDLETLFNPEFERFVGEDATTAAGQQMLNSVLVVGMLPQRLWSREAYSGIDISGLGGEAGQLSPDRIPLPAAPGTDEMHYERRRLEISGEANRPTLEGIEISALEHVPQIIGGFRSMYQLLLANREALLAPDGPLAVFSSDETRLLLRPTRTYDQLLFESFHPDVLGDALQRDLLLDRLWMVVPERPFMAKAINVEQHDLRLGDIPVFTTRPASLSLWTASGDVIEGILLESGMSKARQRVDQLSKRDLQLQEWYIRSSLATLSAFEYGGGSFPNPDYRLLPAKGDFSRDRLLDGARKVADELVSTAILGGDDVTWIGLEHLDEGIWDLAPIGMDLYNGLPGIALFLAYAGSLLGEQIYTSLAQRAAAAILSHIDQFSQDLPGVGAFEGWGGTLYALTHLAHLWNDKNLLSKAQELVEVIATTVDEDENYAVIDGAAGAVATLLALDHFDPSGRIINVAVTCGDHLLGAAQKMESGLGWSVPRLGARPLLGFAHGAGGIAWALYRLAEASRCERFHSAAQEAVKYERSHFSIQAQNWPDLRQIAENGNPDRYPVAWCHGAAGIGLARIRTSQIAGDAHYRDEIEVALSTTLGHGFGQSHALCHGDFGNLELLLETNRAGGDESFGRDLAYTGAMILDSIDQAGWQCGGPQSVKIPGLLIGIAGIGYQMLRMAEPQRVPSVLLLDPPLS